MLSPRWQLSSKRIRFHIFRTPCLTAAVATATRNQSRNSPVSAVDDRVAPERNRRDSPLARPARPAPNARSALPDARDPSTAIVQSPMRGPFSPTATLFPRISPSAKDRISRYVNSSSAERRAREFDYAISIKVHYSRIETLPVTVLVALSRSHNEQRRAVVMEMLGIMPGMNHATDRSYICLPVKTWNNL